MDHEPSSANALAAHLSGYMTDDSTVIAHVKHRFGVEFTKTDIARIRKDTPKRTGMGRGRMALKDRGSEASNVRPYTVKQNGVDPLLKALAKYKLKYANGMDDVTRATYQAIAR